MTIGQYSILSFGDYGKFYVDDDNTHDVTLDGTIEINSASASVDVSKMNISGSGTIDMSPLRPYSSNATAIQTVSNNFFMFSTEQSLPGIKLPFNCKFNITLDLSNAASVSYTVLRKINEFGIDDYNVIRGIDVEIYSNYADTSLELGVTLPSNTHITNKQIGMSLSPLTNNTTTYNKFPYKLLTDDLDDEAHNISADTHFNFGFKGTKAISITGSGKAIFNGDNREYNPKDEDDSPVEITLPDNVEFGKSNSLFQFTQTCKHGVFKSLQELKDENQNDPNIQSLSELSNTIPEGKIVTFTGGFTLGAGHTLIVRGTLIG